MFWRIVTFCLALLWGTHCARNYTVHKQNVRSDKPIYVTEPVLLAQLSGLKSEEEIFNANQFTGEIFFSGPMITDNNGLVHSEKRRLANRSEYATRIIAELRRRIETAPLPRSTKSALAAPALPLSIEKSIAREKHPADGTDNVNLPRMQFDVRWDTARAANVSPGLYLVPIVRHYYGHTGGWFNGQTFGCGAGVRISVAAYIFDSGSGNAVFYFAAEDREIREYNFRSDTVQMSQELARLEERVLRDLIRELREI